MVIFPSFDGCEYNMGHIDEYKFFKLGLMIIGQW